MNERLIGMALEYASEHAARNKAKNKTHFIFSLLGKKIRSRYCGSGKEEHYDWV